MCVCVSSILVNNTTEGSWLTDYQFLSLNIVTLKEHDKEYIIDKRILLTLNDPDFGQEKR